MNLKMDSSRKRLVVHIYIHVCCCEQSKATVTHGSWHLLSSNPLSASHGSSPLFPNKEIVFKCAEGNKSSSNGAVKILHTFHHFVIFLGVFHVRCTLCSFFSSGSSRRKMGTVRRYGWTVFHIHNVLVTTNWTMQGLCIGASKQLLKVPLTQYLNLVAAIES